MRLHHLRFLATVIECGGVTRAAERLHISQPAISAGLKALEQELGATLFDRSGGRHRATPNAKALRLYQQVLEILRLCDAARASFRRAQPAVERLTIGALRTIAADAVATVMTQLPETAERGWRMREGGPDELARWLRQGRIDVAWTTVAADGRNEAVLWREPFVLLAASDHRLAGGRHPKATLADLDGERLVLRGACELKAGRLRAAGIRLRVAAQVDRDDLALKLVAGGVGIAIAPKSLARAGVVAIPLADLGLTRSIGLRWRQDFSRADLVTVREVVSRCGRPQAR